MANDQPITRDNYRDLLRHGASEGLPLLAGEVAWTGTGRAFHFVVSLAVVGLAAGLVVAFALAVAHV